MRLATVLATCLTTTALALSAGVPPAQAASRTVSDPAGDVRTVVISENEDEALEDQASDTSDGDILKGSYTHSKRRITLKLDYAAIPKSGDYRVFQFLLQGRNGQNRVLSLATGEGISGVQTEMNRLSNGRRVCRGAIKRSIDYSARRVTTSFPRWCLGKPRAFRVASLGIRIEGLNSDTDEFTVFYDDAHRDGGSFLEERPAWSPWVRRG